MTQPPLLPRDSNGQPIAALAPVPGQAHQLAVAATSQSLASPLGAGVKLVTLFATVDLHFRFGDSGVAADTQDHLLPAGLWLPVAVPGHELAPLRDLAAVAAENKKGTLFVGEFA